jgi:hypothetical protein
MGYTVMNNRPYNHVDARNTLTEFALEGSDMEYVAKYGIVRNYAALATEIEEAMHESAQRTNIGFCFELDALALWLHQIGMPTMLPWASWKGQRAA